MNRHISLFLSLLFILLFQLIQAQPDSFRSTDPNEFLKQAEQLIREAKPSLAIPKFKLADSLFLCKNDLSSSYKCRYGVLFAELRLGNASYVTSKIGPTIASCEKELGDNSLALARLKYLDAIVDIQFREAKNTSEKAMKAISIYKSQDTIMNYEIANCYNLMGISSYRQNDFKRALEFYLKSLEIKIDLYGEDDISLGSTYNNIAIVYGLSDEPEKAIDFYKKALKIKIKKIGKDHPSVADSQFNIGEIYVGLGQYKKALPYTLEAIRINKQNEELQNFKLAHRLTSLSRIYYYLGESKKAIQIGEESINYYKQAESGNYYIASGYQSHGTLYLDMGRYQEALEQYQLALKQIAGESWVMSETGNPSVTTEIASFRLYQTFFRKAELFKKWYKATGSVELLKNSLDASNALIETIFLLQNDINEVESSINFLDEIRSVFENAIETCYQLYEKEGDSDYIRVAFKIYSESKASLLRQQIQEQQANIRSNIPDSLKQSKSTITNSINEIELKIEDEQNQFTKKRLQDSIFDLKYKLNELELFLKNSYPEFTDLKLTRDTLNYAKLISSIQIERNSILAWFYGDKNIYVFKIDGEEPRLARLAKDTLLDQQILEFASLLKNADRIEAFGKSFELFDEFRTRSHNLYTALMPFSIDDLSSNILILDGLLSLIPFEILINSIDQGNKQVDYASLNYIIKKAPIRYAYSPQLINREEESPMKHKIDFLVCSPTYNQSQIAELTLRSGFTSLKYAKEEAKFLQEQFDATVLSDQNASDISFKKNAPNSRIIHMAMHAFSNDESPQLSSLIFSNSQNPNNENNLHAFEISSLRIPAELIVLSACNTGAGKIVRGEGTLSLARSFMEAGAKNVLMSLWQVDDQATSELLINFYKNLDLGLSKDIALQQSKLSYLNSNTKNFPFYWAAFTLLGDETPLILHTNPSYITYLIPLILLALIIIGFYTLKTRTTKTA